MRRPYEEEPVAHGGPPPSHDVGNQEPPEVVEMRSQMALLRQQISDSEQNLKAQAVALPESKDVSCKLIYFDITLFLEMPVDLFATHLRRLLLLILLDVVRKP